MNLVSSLLISLSLNASFSGSGPLQPSASFTPKNTMSLTNGTGAGAANSVVALSGSLAGSATLAIDLSGSLTDIFGTSVVLARVKAIVIFNKSTVGSDTSLTCFGVTNGVPILTGGTTAKLSVNPGGMVAISDPGAVGYAVTASTADLITIVNAGAIAATYEVYIIGSTV